MLRWLMGSGSTPPSDDAKDKEVLPPAAPQMEPVEGIDEFVVVQEQLSVKDFVKAATESARSTANSRMRRVSSLPQFTGTLTFAAHWAAMTTPPTPPNTPVQPAREKPVKLSIRNLFRTDGDDSGYDSDDEQEDDSKCLSRLD